MILRCTAKLLKEMNISKKDLIEEESQPSLLYDWYANIFFLSRKKNLIFTNTQTLYTFISFDVTRTQIKNIGEIFRQGLANALLDEDFDGATIRQIINDCKEVHIGRTHDKSILGIMVDHVKNVRWMVQEKGNGLNPSNLSEIVKQLNRTPLLTKRFTYSIKELWEILGKRFFISSPTSSNSP